MEEYIIRPGNRLCHWKVSYIVSVTGTFNSEMGPCAVCGWIIDLFRPKLTCSFFYRLLKHSITIKPMQ